MHSDILMPHETSLGMDAASTASFGENDGPTVDPTTQADDMTAATGATITGAYQEAVRLLAPLNVAVIPTRPDEPWKPSIRNPGKLGVRGSLMLAANPRFAHANAAIWAGPRSRITVVDIDSPYLIDLDAAIVTFGDTPLKVRTPSGGMHLYFRHAGERRAIRPLESIGLPLDVLGIGLVVIPPSRRPATSEKLGGQYQFAEGQFADIGRLPILNPGALPDRAGAFTGAIPGTVTAIASGQITGVVPGQRDDALFRCAIALARNAQSEAELIEATLQENARMATPLDVVQAKAKAHSAWRYKAEDRLLGAGDRVAMLPLADIIDLTAYPPALVLLAFLRAHHSRTHVFSMVPDAVAVALDMSPNTVRRARKVLEGRGYLECIQVGGLRGNRKLPNLYMLKK